MKLGDIVFLDLTKCALHMGGGKMAETQAYRVYVDQPAQTFRRGMVTLEPEPSVNLVSSLSSLVACGS